MLYGHLGGGERFETGVWVAQSPATPSDANTAAATAAANFGTDLKATLCGLILNDSGYDGVKVYSYPSGGPAATVIGDAPISAGVGTASGGGAPNQTCVVASLRTNLSGRRYRGRMYLPANGMGLSQHQLTSSLCTSISSAMALWLGRFKDPTHPIILSQVGGFSTAITAVIVDSLPDVQRRHANRMVAIAKASTNVVTT